MTVASSTSAPPLLSVRGIAKRFGGTRALRGVDFTVDRGEVHALVGENGAGKSTLTRILTGALSADQGEVLLDGVNCGLGDPAEGQRLGLRMVHQHDTLVPHLTIAENIFLGRLPRAPFTRLVDWTATLAQARDVVADLGFPDLPVAERACDLSASQRQIAEIAKAVAATPRVLIMDEPSAALAQEDVERVFALVRRLCARGVAVIYISHRLDEVFAIADRVTVLKDGAVTGTVRPGDTDKATLIRMMVGRPLAEIYPQRAARPTEAHAGKDSGLEVRDLARHRAFGPVSFDVAAGEIVGMYGLVGSGRTEVARCLFGADRLTSGTIRWQGRPFAPRAPREALRAGVALLTEDRLGDGLVLGMSTCDNAALASLPAFTRLGLLERVRQRAAVAGKVRELAIRPPDLDREVATLSGGNQQKVVLARWLLAHARLLILDEPTRGVDVGAKRDIYELVARLADDGMAILLISSELPEILGLCDRVLVMREGRIAGSFDRTQASEERLLACASGLASAA